MNMHCRRNTFRFVFQLSHSYTLRCESKCCSNFSIIFPVRENMGRKQTISGKEDSQTSCDKEAVLDNFTDGLIKGKIQKWESQITKSKQEKYTSTLAAAQHPDYLEEIKHNDNISSVKHCPSKPKVSPEIIKRFFTECERKKVIPGICTLSFLLHSCAELGDTESITFAKNIINRVNPDEYQRQSGFNHYFAEAIWKNGNFEDALTLFWNTYEENTLLRDNIKIMLKVLMNDAMFNKGEAVLVLIMRFSKEFANTYTDYSFLSHVWEHCFVSEWHSDNEIASRLLVEHPQLRNIIGLRVNHISSRALVSHKIEIVQRLFEVLLKYEMKTHYELVLRSLFDYACAVRDLYACSAIIQSSHDLDITLTEEQNEKFIQLFCQEDTSQDSKQSINTWNVKSSKLFFKF